MSSATFLQWSYPGAALIWFGAHFSLNEMRARRPHASRSTSSPLDARIPFVPSMAAVYFSGLLFGNAAYVVALCRPEMATSIMIGYLLQFFVSLLTYGFFPCHAERREDPVARTPSGRALRRFQLLSKPFNAFPSMHVSYCLFSGLWVLLAVSASSLAMALVIAWIAAVIASTLVTKQHSVIDVTGGLIIGAVAFIGPALITGSGG